MKMCEFPTKAWSRCLAALCEARGSWNSATCPQRDQQRYAQSLVAPGAQRCPAQGLFAAGAAALALARTAKKRGFGSENTFSIHSTCEVRLQRFSA